MALASLPPGFRFHPTDIELVMYYLKKKVMGKKLQVEAISELNIYLFSPKDLPDKSCLKSKDLEWYFFCPREKKYASGPRMNRATETGFWKTTGKDRTISYNERVVGMVKTLIFHEGNAPRGNRTDWVLHEYRLDDKNLADSGVVQDTFVLCKVFQKSGAGPKNGAQYGAPFNEGEWDDYDDVDVDVTPTLPSNAMLPVMNMLPEPQNFSQETGMAHIPLIVETPQSHGQFSSNNWHHNCQNYTVGANAVDPVSDVGPEGAGPFVNDQFINETNNIAHMLSELSDEDAGPSNENRNIQKLGSGNSDFTPRLTGSDSFLHNLGRDFDAPASQFSFDESDILLQNGVPFLEFDDIDTSILSTVEFSGQELSSGGLGQEHSMFTGLSYVDNGFNDQIGQPFGYGTSFGSQPNYPVLNELHVLPNSFNGLVEPQTAIGYDNNFLWGDGRAEQFYPASNGQPGNIQEKDNSLMTILDSNKD